MAPRILVPWAVDDLPPGADVEVYDGSRTPDDLSQVEFYVLPYFDTEAGVELLGRLPALRAVQVLTAGYEHVVPHLPPGVELYNGAGLHDASTAEHAVGLILAAQRELPRWVLNQQKRHWDRDFTRSLAGSRVLIVGYGHIGAAIEARLIPFEVGITRVARRARPEQDVHSIDRLHDLLPEAGIVVLVVPGSAQTTGLIGAPELALMPDDALLVNVGRGTAVDTGALVAEKGRIRAALDVVEPEPLPPDHPLWSVPNVLITPHMAGGSATFVPRAQRLVADQLRRWTEGQPLENRVALDG